MRRPIVATNEPDPSPARRSAAGDAAVLPLFDAHLDLAYLERNGRAMLKPIDRLINDDDAPHPPASVTLPELVAAHVVYALATVYTRPGRPDERGAPPEAYDPFDAESAHAAGVDQLDVYARWADAGLCSLATDSNFEPSSAEDARSRFGPVPLHLGVLIENADPIRSPDELPFWRRRGVVAVSLTWATRGRYASGNATPPTDDNGVTDLGRALLRAMHDEHLALDVSHLADRSLVDALTRFEGVTIASHSNCRSLAGVGDPTADQRHLTDDTIQEIAARDGVVGLNLHNAFLTPRDQPDGSATLDHAVAHVLHVCELTGSTRHVGLGTDLDGGFSADRLPAGIRRARDLHRLLDALRDRGFTDADLRAFASDNWLRVFAKLHRARHP